MKCPKCQFDNPDTQKFCGECGTNITSVEESQPQFTKTLESPAIVLNQGKVLADRFEILEKIGEGGMGEVYLAVDKNLDRQVAVKVLPSAFAEDAERLARFEREAKLLAVLNHPNIAAIYGLEDSEDRRFLVLELVEGETLKAKLDKGPIEVEEALDLCRQITEGLEAAHEKGIIHRDLKPGNIMITPEGKVKILDFGLAKAFTGETTGTGIDIEKSPTITAQMTKPGIVLGTAAYMSPEQARGRAVDKKTDIWAFGCVLFECLTGMRAFEGETVSDNLALILRGEPDWKKLPVNTPTIIRVMLQRCLQKAPKDRMHDIADVRIEIMDVAIHPTSPEALLGVRPQGIGWFIALALFAIAIATTGGILLDRVLRKPTPGSMVHLDLNLPYGLQLTERGGRQTEFSLSPDGNFLIFSASHDGSMKNALIYKRSMDSLDATPVEGTEGGMAPFFSPEGDWIGFWAEKKLYKVPLEGGIPTTLCDFPRIPFGAFWASDGRIFLGTLLEGLQVVSANGGQLEMLAKVDEGKESSIRLPFLLPGGKEVVFTSMPHRMGVEARIELLSLGSGDRCVLIEDGADARYTPTGHLVFLRKGILMAVPFDLNRRRVSGAAVPVVKGIMQAFNTYSTTTNTGAGQYCFSTTGVLAYVSGGINPDPLFQLVWMDRNGQAEPWTVFGKKPISFPRLSPDGMRVIFHTLGLNQRIWMYDIQRETTSSLFTSTGVAQCPIWDPTGTKIAFAWSEGGPKNIWWKPRDSSTEMQQLTNSNRVHWPSSWTRDGKYISLVETGDPINRFDILVIRVEDKHVIRFAADRSWTQWPDFSPDGRWMAYGSNESGRNEVYVRSFPSGDKKQIISNQGGSEPLWAPDGKELFYWDLKGDKLMKVDISIGQNLNASVPKVLFELSSYRKSGPLRNYDITPDGQRFLLVVPIQIEHDPEEEEVTQLNIIQNWFEELKRLVPTEK